MTFLILPDLILLSLEVSVPRTFGGLLDNPSTITEFQFPLLQYLDIDGWNFVDLHRNALWWTEDLLNTRHLSDLTVAHYRPTQGIHGEGPFETLSAFPLFKSVASSTLGDLEFEFF
ncbi:hypothetical protein DXG03_003383, partial [Asterophora parasitica]